MKQPNIRELMLGLGWGRSKRFLATFCSAALLFGAVGAPVALADGSGSSSPPPVVGSPAWLAMLTSAINFGSDLPLAQGVKFDVN